MSSFRSLRSLTSFLFLALIVLGSMAAPSAPMPILIMAVCLFAIGVPLAVYAFKALERYKEVFDYEPTEFWGRTSNGKQARENLMTMSTTGLWCGLSGIALMLVVAFRLKVIVIP